MSAGYVMAAPVLGSWLEFSVNEDFTDVGCGLRSGAGQHTMPVLHQPKSPGFGNRERLDLVFGGGKKSGIHKKLSCLNRE